jgi:putative DNA-invertase from lambdoid prophage Rac
VRRSSGTPAAAYVRVSTEEQTTDNQRPEIARLARARGYDVQAWYNETASAAGKRPAFTNMMADAHRGAFRVLLIWAIDRFGRTMVGNLTDLLALDQRGVQVVSVRESWLDTTGPARSLLIAVFSWWAEQERARLIERTRAGLDRARAKGKRLGRPPARVDVPLARLMLGEGLSLRRTAQELRVPASTLSRALGRRSP